MELVRYKKQGVEVVKKHLSILLLSFLSLICLTATACFSRGSYNVESASVDVNLTGLSSTVAYAAIINILQAPDNYIGKRIKVSGAYQAFYYEEFDRYLHFVVIEGPGGCCPQAIKFVYGEDRTSPDDYPTENAMIEIAGVFNSSEEMGSLIYYLAVDSLTIK